MSTFKDYFSGHAQDYARYRPKYPEAVFRFISELAPSHTVAWDCGCGNGQAAIALTKYFKKVIATDASKAQIDQAFQCDAIAYRVAPAEHSGIESNCLDAIVCANALHWFDLDAFFQEARRTMRNGAVIAVWAYGRASANPELDLVVESFNQRALASLWAPETNHIVHKYKSFEFPFHEIEAPTFDMSMQWTFEQFAGYLSTWSAMQSLVKQQGTDRVEQFFEELKSAWGNPEKVRTVKTPLFMRIGTKA